MQRDNSAGTINQQETVSAISEPQEQERRLYPRASVLAELHQMIFVELGSTGGLLLNISEGGISVQAAHAIEQDAKLGVKFRLPFGRHLVQAPCEVAWSDGGHVGLKFARLSEVEQRQLGLWLEGYGTGPIDAAAIEASPPVIRQEVAKDNESWIPISAASCAGSEDPSVSTFQPEPTPHESDRARVGDEVLSLTGADGAAIGPPDDQGVTSEISQTDESLRANRRASERWLVAIPMLARWTDDREHEVKVSSRDVSEVGIFFHANSDIEIGTEIEVSFTLPSHPGAAGNRRLRVQGKVIRAERGTEKTGYALAVTRSELLKSDDAVARARQAVGRLSNNNACSGGPFRIRTQRARLFSLAFAVLMSLAVLAGVGIFIARYEGGPADAIAEIRQIVARILPTPGNARPAYALRRGVDGKSKDLRTSWFRATENKSTSSPAEQPARNFDPSVAQVSSKVDSIIQLGPLPFNNRRLVTLDIQKRKPVSLPANPVDAGSLATKRLEAATTTPNTAAVVLRVIVGGNGTVEDVQRVSGPANLAAAGIAAIRDWKFQPDPHNMRTRQIYVTVHFTTSTEPSN